MLAEAGVKIGKLRLREIEEERKKVERARGEEIGRAEERSWKRRGVGRGEEKGTEEETEDEGRLGGR